MSLDSEDSRNGSEPAGGKGGPSPRDESGLRPAEQNKLIRMALNDKPKTVSRRFELTEFSKRLAIETTERNMLDEDGRVSNGAVANLIKMEALNQKESHHADGDLVTHNHTGTIELAAVRQELLKNANVIEHCRHDSQNGNPGPVCPNGESRPLANGSAPGEAGPGHNGHTNGNGRH